jgi:hypothetical protein
MPEVMRYFYADAPIVALVGPVQGTDTEARQRLVVEHCYKLRMTPMIPDAWLGPEAKIAEWMGPLTRQYLTPDGQWREKPG